MKFIGWLFLLLSIQPYVSAEAETQLSILSNDQHSNSSNIVIGSVHWPPYTDMNVPGKGLISEIVTAAYSAVNLTTTTKFLPPKRLIRLLETGKTIDVDCTLWGNAIGDDKTYTSVPYYKNAIHLFYNKRSIAANRPPTDHSSPKIVGILKGAYYPSAFISAISNDFIIEEAPNIVRLIKMLSRNRYDAILADAKSGQYALESMNSRDIKRSKKPHHEPSLHCISSKANPKGKMVITAFNKGIAIIRANGVYNSILTIYQASSEAKKRRAMQFKRDSIHNYVTKITY